MPTISDVCANLFSQTNLSKLEKKPDRATRRALARVIYRTQRRPGLVDPQPAQEKGAVERRKTARNLGVSQRPMRHVYRLHEPKLPKPGSLLARLRDHMVPNLFKYDDNNMRQSGNPQRLFKGMGRI